MVTLPWILHGLAAVSSNCDKNKFLGFPHWYEYLNVGGKDCQVTSFAVPGDLILVVLALIEILLRLAGLAAVVFVIIGGVQYVTSQGNPDATSKAQSTIINALIGLALAVTAIAFVSFLGHKLG